MPDLRLFVVCIPRPWSASYGVWHDAYTASSVEFKREREPEKSLGREAVNGCSFIVYVADPYRLVAWHVLSLAIADRTLGLRVARNSGSSVVVRS